jgi:phosphoglycerate dehydrogenase-like enzyme
MTHASKSNHSFDPKVVVTSISFSKSIVLKKSLLNVFPNSIFNETGQRLSGGKLIKFINNADAAIVGIEIIDDSLLKHTPSLKIISKYGVGLDSIDQKSLKDKGITLGWTGGVNQRSVSELTLGFMLGLCRNLFTSGYKLKNGVWEKDGGQQLSGKTIGIIGCGHVGSEVIRLLSPFECSILVYDILDKSKFCQSHRARIATLEEVIHKSDLISLHVPLTNLTKGMVNENFLEKMKPTGFLINTSRGNIVDQNSLKKALINGQIKGAALDVFEEEPPQDYEFLLLPNLMVTPHIGGNAEEAINAMGLSAINHLISFFNKLPK